MTQLTEVGFTLKDIVDEVEAGAVSARVHPDDFNLVIYNYTPQTAFGGAWNSVTRLCRGLILRVDGDSAEIVARPFPKFFNLGELDSVPEGPFTAQEKMDGSLGIIYKAPDGLPSVATRGSFASDQAIWATAFLRNDPVAAYDAASHIAKNQTPLVEIIYPDNRIVVDYGDFGGLVGLTAIDNATGLDVPLHWEGLTAEYHAGFTLDLFADQNSTNREGVVLLWESGERAKMKFDDYVRLHKIITNVSEKSIWEMLSQRLPIDSLAEHVPDEFFKWMKGVEADLNRQFTELEQSCFKTLSKVVREEPRKNQAEFILTQPNSHIVFKMLDGQSYSDLIWKELQPKPKPKGDADHES